MRTIWFGIALLAVSTLSRADEPPPDAGDEVGEAGSESASDAGSDPFPEPEPEPEPASAEPSCRPVQQLDAVVTKVLSAADTNHDDHVTKAEAQKLAEQLVNKFFFRADANRNGTITPKEARQARTTFMIQEPVLSTLARQCRGRKVKGSFTRLARLLDIEYGKPVNVAEARSAARAAVDDLFRLADRDKDGSIDAEEAAAATAAGAYELGRQVFRSADADRDGGLSVDELKSSIDAPLRLAFSLADADNDGKLDEPEAVVAVEELSRRLVLPTAAPPESNRAQN